MKKNLIFSMVSSAFLLLLLALPGCAGAEQPAERANGYAPIAETERLPLHVLTIGTADSGGTMYPVGSAIASAISSFDHSIQINLSASNGSAANAAGLRDGQMDLGLVSGDIAYDACRGIGEFAEAPAENLRAVAAVYSSISNWMVPSDTNLYYVHDLTGRRIAVGPQSSTTEQAARVALKAVGLTDDNAQFYNYGLKSGSLEVEKGRLDAIHGFAGIPVGGLTELSEKIPSRLLKYTPEELEEILSANPFYFNAIIPAGTYPGQLDNISTFGIKCLLCVDASMDESLVYQITKILDEARPQLMEKHHALSGFAQDEYMCSELPIPLHPGAEKYFKEMGYLK